MRAQWLVMCALAVAGISVVATGCSDAPAADGSDGADTGTGPNPTTGHDAGKPSTGIDSGKGTGNPTPDAGTSGDDDATVGDDDDDDDASTGTDTGTGTTDPCTDPSLDWQGASKTNFTSYPAPGSAECIQYSGCQYEGQFEGCNSTQTLNWVQTHNIVAIFPSFKTYGLHDLCLRKGNSTIVVTAYDTCADSDCSGCCTKNAKPSGNLIDVESFTDARWGVDDGQIEFADLGPTKTGGCN